MDYGSDLFGRAGRTVSAKSKPHRFTTNVTDFFAQRVLRYWNSLPPLVKVSESVTGFKRGLDAFRLHGYQANKLGHYWELSYDIFDRIDESVSNRNSYVSYRGGSRELAVSFVGGPIDGLGGGGGGGGGGGLGAGSS